VSAKPTFELLSRNVELMKTEFEIVLLFKFLKIKCMMTTAPFNYDVNKRIKTYKRTDASAVYFVS